MNSYWPTGCAGFMRTAGLKSRILLSWYRAICITIFSKTTRANLKASGLERYYELKPSNSHILNMPIFFFFFVTIMFFFYSCFTSNFVGGYFFIVPGSGSWDRSFKKDFISKKPFSCGFYKFWVLWLLVSLMFSITANLFISKYKALCRLLLSVPP